MRGSWLQDDAEIRLLVAIVDGAETNVVEVRRTKQAFKGNSKRSWTEEQLEPPFYILDDEGQGTHKVLEGEGRAIWPDTLIEVERIVRERAHTL